MHNRAHFHRYTDDCLDLCDVLSSFNCGSKVKLDELSRIMGLPGKPDGIDGSHVEPDFNAGRIQQIADYCESHVIKHVPSVAASRTVQGTVGRSSSNSA